MTFVTPVLIPAIIAGLFWLVSFHLWDRTKSVPNGHWGGALAVGAGYFAGHVTLVSWPPMPPNTAEEWLAVLVAPLAVVALLERWWGARAWAGWPAMVVAATLFIWPQSQSLFEYRWSLGESALWLVGFVVLVVAVWDLTNRLARRHAGPYVPLLLWAITTATSVALALTGSALLGQLAGAIAGILGATVVLALWARRLSLHTGAVTMWTLLTAALLWQGHLYSELRLASALFLFCAPVVVWVAEWRPIRDRGMWARAGARVVLVAIPLAVAMALAYQYWASVQADEYMY